MRKVFIFSAIVIVLAAGLAACSPSYQMDEIITLEEGTTMGRTADLKADPDNFSCTITEEIEVQVDYIAYIMGEVKYHVRTLDSHDIPCNRFLGNHGYILLK
jgi:hypothetical protein